MPTTMTTATAWTSVVVLALSGCATTKEEVLPENMPTMAEVYRDHASAGNTGEAALLEARASLSAWTVGSGDADLSGWTREAAYETALLFPRVPNPTIVLYVYPHVTRAGLPVPGYATAFPMYDAAPFALPGEAPPPSRPPLAALPQ